MSTVHQQVAVEDLVRLATDDELQHYWEHGWVKMEGLVSRETAFEMLDAAKIAMKDTAKTNQRDTWIDRYMVGRDDMIEPFATVSRSNNIARNVQLFARRDFPVGLHADLLAIKMPSGHGASRQTGYHQDYPNKPVDRVGMLVFWIALDDLVPEQGVMRFYSGSHREGSLGWKFKESEGRDLLDRLPYIEETYPLSPPLHMKAGDCTVHHSCVIHGAPSNVTETPRWTYLPAYYPGDCCWTGDEHFIFNEAAGLEKGKPIRSPKFPMLLGE